MGTSSIYDGPVKSLLPGDYNDFDDNNPEDDQEHPDIPEDLDEENPQWVPCRWKDAKDAMTTYAKGSSSDKGKVMSRYVGASGGSSQLTKSSVSGRNATLNLGRVIQGFREIGVEKTLQS